MMEKIKQSFRNPNDTRPWWVVLVIMLALLVVVQQAVAYVYTFQEVGDLDDFTEISNNGGGAPCVMSRTAYTYSDTFLMYLFHPYQYWTYTFALHDVSYPTNYWAFTHYSVSNPPDEIWGLRLYNSGKSYFGGNTINVTPGA